MRRSGACDRLVVSRSCRSPARQPSAPWSEVCPWDSPTAFPTTSTSGVSWWCWGPRCHVSWTRRSSTEARRTAVRLPAVPTRRSCSWGLPGAWACPGFRSSRLQLVAVRAIAPTDQEARCIRTRSAGATEARATGSRRDHACYSSGVAEASAARSHGAPSRCGAARSTRHRQHRDAAVCEAQRSSARARSCERPGSSSAELRVTAWRHSRGPPVGCHVATDHQLPGSSSSVASPTFLPRSTRKSEPHCSSSNVSSPGAEYSHQRARST